MILTINSLNAKRSVLDVWHASDTLCCLFSKQLNAQQYIQKPVYILILMVTEHSRKTKIIKKAGIILCFLYADGKSYPVAKVFTEKFRF